MALYSTIAEMDHFIVLDEVTHPGMLAEEAAGYQSEAMLEQEFIVGLQRQGYERIHLKNPQELLANARVQLQALNGVEFTDAEWERFARGFLDCPGEGLVERTRKLHNNHVCDFKFDNGRLKNIYLVDKNQIARNRVQVVNQFAQAGTHANRYDVTILVNGLPLVQVELKRRGVAIREAFYQVHRYTKESFNHESSLFRYLQIFVISNGTDTRYFANTVQRDRNSFPFTMNWAGANNKPIKDLEDFTTTFFQKNTLLQVLLKYSVFDTRNTLLIMRPYQIAAVERMLWKICSAHEAKAWATPEGGGYIWHTTGSGKTLTSFKAAQLASKLDFIDRVFFVVDRKDLDYQTMLEYQRFSPGSVNGSESTAGLKRNLEQWDCRIIVTTIQKLNNLMRSERDLPVYHEEVVFIFDEAHRSQFGEAQRNLQRKFKKYYQFGFTGTPIFPENAAGDKTTQDVFGLQLHAYIITDAIRDGKVLKFKVDYNDVRPKFKKLEAVQDEAKLSAAENQKLLLHPDRIHEISRYILQNFNIKTHRNQPGVPGFNAMFAVNSIEAAKLYYQELNRLQEGCETKLKIATIYSYAPNEEQAAVGEIADESFDPSAMDSTAKEFLAKAIRDYNVMFRTNFGVESGEFQNYYRDLARRVREQEVDLVIVVGMFLTGFDAPRLNTLFVDKNLRYHGLIQAFSRTNRIYDATKAFGNIVTFRNLEQATIDAITLFGDRNKRTFILEKGYREYLEGFRDIVSGEARRGYIEVVRDLKRKFPHPEEIVTEEAKREFVELFGEYLKLENILQNFDEFAHLRAFQAIDKGNPEEVEKFRKANFLTEGEIESMKGIEVLEARRLQDYRSAYNDIRHWVSAERNGAVENAPGVDWNDVVFEVELLKSQEINLDYILELILERKGDSIGKDLLVDEVRRMVRASVSNRAKEELLIDFINETDLEPITTKERIVEAFFTFAQARMLEESAALIAEENLNEEPANRYISLSLKRGYASMNGTDLNETLPRMSPLRPEYLVKKRGVFSKISAFVEKYRGVGGQL